MMMKLREMVSPASVVFYSNFLIPVDPRHTMITAQFAMDAYFQILLPTNALVLKIFLFLSLY